MQNEHKLVAQVKAAQTNDQMADALIRQYLPFIKSETAKHLGYFVDEKDDELNIALFAFYEAILSYNASKGSFLSLASISIRNRLIDFNRKEVRHKDVVSLSTPSTEDEDRTLADMIPDKKNEFESFEMRTATKQEIAEFSETLQLYGLSLSDLADNCPKQERTLMACMQVLDYAKKNSSLLTQLVETKRLPLKQLALGAGIPRKTLERHRDYLIGILLAYTNGFEIIRGHLRMIKRKEASCL